MSSIPSVSVVQHWSPISQVERGIEPDMWLMFDKSKRIAIIRIVEVRDRGTRCGGHTATPHISAGNPLA